MDDTVISQPKPPYATVNQMNKLFDLLYTRSFNSINPSDLQVRGFSQSDSFQLVASLKFLGLLNDDNTATEKLSKIQLRGDQRTTAIKDIVEESYKDLFSVVKDPNKLSRDGLHNEITAVYKVSPRVARTAAPLFMWLCKLGGMEVAEDVVPKGFASPKKQLSPVHKQGLAESSLRFDSQAHQTQNGDFVDFPIGKKLKLRVPEEEKYLKRVVNPRLSDIFAELVKIFEEDNEDSEEETPEG